MPPKRKAKKEDIETEFTNNLDETSKKQRFEDQNLSGTINSQENSNTIDKVNATILVNEEESEEKPECRYGATCYRKNPQHFKEFRHPGDETNDKQTISTTSTTPSISPTKDTQNLSDIVSSYQSLLQLTLTKNKISTDEKRLLRQYRKKHNINDSDHFKLLKQFGWTEDEYDDGIKQDDDIELDEEHKILDDENGFAVIKITKKEANKSKAHLNVFSKVCTKFYETMSKAQANFSVIEVGVIVNTKLKKNFSKKKMEINAYHNQEMKEDWGFHGTTRDSIMKIAQNGFLLPDELKALSKAQTKSKKSNSQPKHQKPIDLLDDGYYGKGIYFTTFSDYALWYSEERNSDQVLLSKLLIGKPYRCDQRMDGLGLMKGYDCHVSPKGNEIVLFSKEQILPRYIITFVEKEAQEREQES